MRSTSGTERKRMSSGVDCRSYQAKKQVAYSLLAPVKLHFTKPTLLPIPYCQLIESYKMLLLIFTEILHPQPAWDYSSTMTDRPLPPHKYPRHLGPRTTMCPLLSTTCKLHHPARRPPEVMFAIQIVSNFSPEGPAMEELAVQARWALLWGWRSPAWVPSLLLQTGLGCVPFPKAPSVCWGREAAATCDFAPLAVPV